MVRKEEESRDVGKMPILSRGTQLARQDHMMTIGLSHWRRYCFGRGGRGALCVSEGVVVRVWASYLSSATAMMRQRGDAC